jgi:phosphoribosylanthranilate isomerase
MPKTRAIIKICGLTREEDVDAAVAAGADAIGFVFYPPSPRYVTLQRAAELVRRIPPFVDVVGLFVNEAPEAVVRAACEALPINVLQFHGDEDAAYCRQFSRPICGRHG